MLPKIYNLPCLKLLTLLSHENTISVDSVKVLLGKDWEDTVLLLKAKGAIVVSNNTIRPGIGQPVVEDSQLFSICKSCKCDCTYTQADVKEAQSNKWTVAKNVSPAITLIKEYYSRIGAYPVLSKPEIIVISNMVKEYGEPNVRLFLEWLSCNTKPKSLLKSNFYYKEYQSTHAQ